MTWSLIFRFSGRMDFMYTLTRSPGSRSPRQSARPERLGASSMNTPYSRTPRTTPSTASPGAKAAAFSSQVPSSCLWVR